MINFAFHMNTFNLSNTENFYILTSNVIIIFTISSFTHLLFHFYFTFAYPGAGRLMILKNGAFSISTVLLHDISDGLLFLLFLPFGVHRGVFFS